MASFGWCKTACAVYLITISTSIAAPAQTFRVLANFGPTDGVDPNTLIQGADGNFYGTTLDGGANLFGGTVFKITPDGAVTILHNFCSQPGCPDGAGSDGALVQGTDGDFYGTTESGGNSSGGGTVFKITSEGTLITLYSFCNFFGCANGDGPLAPLIQAIDGNFYGSTIVGGTYGGGIIFRITSSGVLTTVYNFCPEMGCKDGYAPEAALVEGLDGNFYGTTANGGDESCNPPYGCGTVFKLTPGGTLTGLHTFESSDGMFPSALVQLKNGNLYGTTPEGGLNNHGTIFEISPAGNLKTIYNFCIQTNCADGAAPVSGLIEATDGNLYGTTVIGGNPACRDGQGCGTLFRMTPSGHFATVFDFSLATGSGPAGLLQATDGKFYGSLGPSSRTPCWLCSTIYSLDIGLGPFVRLERYSGGVGQNSGILGQGFTGTTGVWLNGTPANFTVKSDTYIRATVPAGATSGYVTVQTPTGMLTSNRPFRVMP